MKFVRSLTVARSEIAEFVRLWSLCGDQRAPFENLILTPLPSLTVPSRVNAVREHFAGRSHIMFDSGGYAVQQGIIRYEDLYQQLLSFYRDNEWADVYVMPDYVLTGGLSDAEVDDRVNATISVAHLFHTEMPPELRRRAMPVVQGYTRQQIRRCVEAYLELGFDLIGFGSFATTGVSSDINIMTAKSVELLAFLGDLAAQHGLRVHAFGVGSPRLLPVLHEMGVYSFDSSCWLRTAGFGNVFLPFAKRRSITGGRLREQAGHRPLTSGEFSVLQQETEHSCYFCRSFDELRQNRFYQILHNLTVIMDTVDSLNSGSYLEHNLLIELIEAGPHLRTARELRGGRQ